MKTFILILFSFPLFLKAQTLDTTPDVFDTSASRAFNILFTSISNTYFDSETLFYLEEFELHDSSAVEVISLFSRSSLTCNIAWTNNEYKKILKSTGMRFSRKFDNGVRNYCECFTGDYNVFLWNTKEGSAYGVVISSTNPI
jgi:hypothetical protein